MPALGIHPIVLCLGTDQTLLSEFMEAGIEVVFVPPGSRWSRILFIWKFIRSGQFNLVHTMLFWPDVVVRPLARLAGIRVVSSLTNEYYGTEHRRNSRYGTPGVRVAQIADAISSQFAVGFHAISARSAHIMSRRLALRPSRISVIYRGRDLALLGQRSTERRAHVREVEAITTEAVFICVGRQDFQKGHEVAVRAFSQIAGQWPSAQLWLVGRPGGNSSVIQSTIQQSPAESRIRDFGERADVADLLCAADYFVMPSRFEGLAGTVIEAMALEIPLILTDIEVFREVSDNKALFFQRDDIAALARAMQSCLEQQYPPGWTAELRLRTETLFDIERVTAELADFYRKWAL